jgi:hypothetical protein
VDSSGCRDTSRKCGDGAKESSALRSSWSQADAFARSSDGRAPGASTAVLGGSGPGCFERAGSGGYRRGSRCRSALISRMWRYATVESSPSFRALPVLRRARRDRHSSCSQLQRARDCYAPGPLPVNNLARITVKRLHTGGQLRVSGHNRSVACRSAREASQSCQARRERATEAVCAGSARRFDHGSRRCNRAGSRGALDRTVSRSSKGLGGGQPRGVLSRLPIGYESTSPMMGLCGYRTKRATRRSTFKGSVRCVGR